MGSPGWIGALATFLILQVCHGSTQSALVVGAVTCDECSENHGRVSLALSAASVAIECRNSRGGDLLRRAEGSIDGNGAFSVSLPQHILNAQGDLAEECFAKVRSGSKRPCPEADDVATKLVLKSKRGGTNIYIPSGRVSLSSLLACQSAFLWPKHKIIPHLPPKKYFPPKYDHPLFPPKEYFPPKYDHPLLPPKEFFPPKDEYPLLPPKHDYPLLPPKEYFPPKHEYPLLPPKPYFPPKHEHPLLPPKPYFPPKYEYPPLPPKQYFPPKYEHPPLPPKKYFPPKYEHPLLPPKVIKPHPPIEYVPKQKPLPPPIPEFPPKLGFPPKPIKSFHHPFFKFPPKYPLPPLHKLPPKIGFPPKPKLEPFPPLHKFHPKIGFPPKHGIPNFPSIHHP